MLVSLIIHGIRSLDNPSGQNTLFVIRTEIIRRVFKDMGRARIVAAMRKDLQPDRVGLDDGQFGEKAAFRSEIGPGKGHRESVRKDLVAQKSGGSSTVAVAILWSRNVKRSTHLITV